MLFVAGHAIVAQPVTNSFKLNLLEQLDILTRSAPLAMTNVSVSSLILVC